MNDNVFYISLILVALVIFATIYILVLAVSEKPTNKSEYMKMWDVIVANEGHHPYDGIYYYS